MASGSGFQLSALASADSKPNCFESLSPELLEYICLFLYGKDLANMASTCSRFKAVVANSKKLMLQLYTQLSFVRAVRVSRYQRDLKATTSYFRFLRPELQARKNYLLELASKIPTGRNFGGHGNLILVIAQNVEEADLFYRSLLNRHFEARIALSYISRDNWAEYQSIRKRFFLVTLKVVIDFEMPRMAGIVDFRNPRDRADYLDVQSINPRRCYQVFTASQENFEVWFDLYHFLMNYSSDHPSVMYDSPLELDRSFFQARARAQAGPVFKIFG